LLKSDGLLYKLFDRCRCTDKKCRDKHKEQIKLYRDQYYFDNQDKIKEYREFNKDILKEKAKEYIEANKDNINAKRSERITCECGCTSRRDKNSQHEKSSCLKKIMEEKTKLKRNLTNEELDIFFRTNYTFQNYPKDILITSYSQTIYLKFQVFFLSLWMGG
jgi:hypothetical protein